MLVLTRSGGRPSKSSPMSWIVEIATPTRPTSPRARGASLSYPICVGKSKATLRPSLPCSRRYRNRRFVSFAVPKPAYWRMVQRRPRYIVARAPRVKGGSPGNPSVSAKSAGERWDGVTTTSKARSLPVLPDAVNEGDRPCSRSERDLGRFFRVAMALRTSDQRTCGDKGYVSRSSRTGRAEGPQDRTDVNRGRLEELLPPGSPALWEGIEDRQGRVREDAAGQRQAVGVDPGARKADDHVARPDRAAVDDLRLEDGPEAGPREVDLPDEFRDDGDLSTDDRDVRELRATVQADADLASDFLVVGRDRDIVDERERLRPDADHVVHIHRDAVDADRVPPAHLLRDEDLRADAVRAEGERVGSEVDEPCEVADLREGLAGALPAVPQGRGQGRGAGRLLVLAHAGLGIGSNHAQATQRGHFKRQRAG